MSLFDKWTELVEVQRDDKELRDFWTGYYEQEKQCYIKILSEKITQIKGTVGEIAKNFNLDDVFCVGLLEGMNTSLVTPIEKDVMEKFEEDSKVDVTLDYEKLYYNMLDAKANWLYELSEWDDILSEEKRKEITKAYRVAGIVVNEDKVGRNDPCPCGSGKKYKKCCFNK